MIRGVLNDQEGARAESTARRQSQTAPVYLPIAVFRGYGAQLKPFGRR